MSKKERTKDVVMGFPKEYGFPILIVLLAISTLVYFGSFDLDRFLLEENKKEFVIKMDLKEESEDEYYRWMNIDCRDRKCLKEKFFSFTNRCNDIECLDFFNLLLIKETYKILYYEFCLNTTNYNEKALELCDDYIIRMGGWRYNLEVKNDYKQWGDVQYHHITER